MSLLLQQIIDGAANGALYAAMGVAIVLVYRATGVLNFAQGEMALVSTFFIWQLAAWGLPIYLAAVVGLVFSFAFGAAVERGVMRPLRDKPPLASVLAALGLFLVCNQVCALIWPGAQREFPALTPMINFELAGLRIGAETLLLFAVLAAQAVFLFLFFRHTPLGLKMRAAADDAAAAVYIGVDPSRMFMLGWGLAAVFGCLAGLLVAPSILLTTGMMFPLLIYGLCAATLGGLTNPFGAIAGGIIIGVVENLTATYVPLIGVDLKIAAPLGLIFLVLLLRPQGLFGARQVSRV